MTDNILPFPGKKIDRPTGDILESAKLLTSVIVLGYDAEENEYFATSIGDAAEVIWLLKRMEHVIMQSYDAAED